MKNFKCLWIVACCLSLSACIPEQKKGVADAVEGSDTSSTADMVVQPPGCVEGLANARFCISGTLRDVLTGAPITGLTWSNYRLMVLNLSSLTPKATACKVDPVLGWIGTPTYFDSCPLNKSRNATYNATTGAFEIKDLPAGSPDSQLVLYLVDLTAPIADRVLVLTMQLVPGYSGKVENFANVDVWALRSADVDRIYRLEDPEQNKPVVYENWTDLNNLTAVLVKVIGDKRSGLR
ncbi:MAG: hypothetical protein KC609_12815, partial [Myxococcales bacterium]|nr:hypothetical protein [Myxococcales bacterium]